MAHVTAIIPARLESQRFSRKVLYPLKGKPLIFYTWRAARRARSINRLFVATDSTEVGRAVNKFGGAVIMTSRRPRNGTERVAEAVSNLRTDIVINIQADNIGATGAVMDRVIQDMSRDKSIEFATIARKIGDRDWRKKLYNPDVVKVVGNNEGQALWFSRYPIPFVRVSKNRPAIARYPFLEHIGIYFYRREALDKYLGWARAKTEKAESLEQLRILENGAKIKLFVTRAEIISVDSKQALNKLGTKVA